MGAIFSSETSVEFRRTGRRYALEDRTLHNHRCENLSTCIDTALRKSDLQLLIKYVYKKLFFLLQFTSFLFACLLLGGRIVYTMHETIYATSDL
jgi:hypothetical protein